MNDLSPGEARAADALIDLALAEDLGDLGDVTGDATIPAGATGAAWVVAREPGIVAGLPVVARLASRVGLGEGWSALVDDGAAASAGLRVARVAGPLRAILAFERTALNFLQHLSGVATLTARYVAAVAGTRAVVLDTRKTLAGWRLLQKYAVRAGGGANHRIGLFDGVLIKDNHLAGLASGGDPIGRAVAAGRAAAPPGAFVEVEVDDEAQLERALALDPGPDMILLDNFDPARLSAAVDRRDRLAPGVLLEASGGVNLATVRAIAESGVDRISVGALTHSAPALDLGLDFDDGASR